MFYKPTYCCNCGEKIEKTESLPWSSGRFCDVCKTEFSFQEWLPKVFILVFGLFGLLGIGSYLRSGEKEQIVSLKQKKNFVQENSDKNDTPANQIQNSNREIVRQNEQKTESDSAIMANKNKAEKPKIVGEPIENEKTYFCGAMTKKGTPCSRKVKGGGRCWQHKGQDALLAQEKLLIPQ
ncbi:MAG: hypothetical protein ACR2F2_10755 [Pyrinomonadaceae bacterium]